MNSCKGNFGNTWSVETMERGRVCGPGYLVGQQDELDPQGVVE